MNSAEEESTTLKSDEQLNQQQQQQQQQQQPQQYEQDQLNSTKPHTATSLVSQQTVEGEVVGGRVEGGGGEEEEDQSGTTTKISSTGIQSLQQEQEPQAQQQFLAQRLQQQQQQDISSTQAQQQPQYARKATSNNNNNNICNTEVLHQHRNTGGGGVTKFFKSFLIRFSVNFSLFLTKLKFITDDILSSDEIEYEIFYPTDSSSVLSELYEDNDEDIIPSYNMMQDNKFEQQEYPLDDIRNINIEEKLKQMRASKPDEPFVDGDKLWHLQNRRWLLPSEDLNTINGQLKLQKKLAEQELKHLVSTKDYSIIYNNLVLKNKNLKKPMNLKDLLKVINAGWTVHKTWERAAQGLA